MSRGRTSGVERSAAIVALLCALPSGCDDAGRKTVKEAQEQRALEGRIRELEREVVSRDDLLRAQARQIQAMQGMGGPERLQRLPHAVRIELDALTGGFDSDKQTGDEGVVVYLRPYDSDNDVIKAAGAARVVLVDLAASGEAKTLGECVLDEAGLRKAWYGRFMTGHYTIKCPWRGSPPTRPEVTVRVQFIDAVTGETFEQVKLVKVTLPPQSTSGSR